MAEDKEQAVEAKTVDGPNAKGGQPTGGYGSGYGKKPMWFWVVLYVIIGGLVYWGIYAWYSSKNTSSSSGSIYGGSSSSNGSLYGTK